MKIDKDTRAAILAEVREAVTLSLAMNESYVSGKELGKKYQMFSVSWLKCYGHLLPRTRAVVTMPDGSSHVTGWCYPMNRIGKMIESGEIKRLAL